MIRLLKLLSHAIFWTWNLGFLLLMLAGILPFVGIYLIIGTFTGQVPLDFSLTFLLLVGVPLACTILAGLRFRTQPLQLMRLFYGVEAPLFLLGLIRLFVLREIPLASAQILCTVLVCIGAFFVHIVWGSLLQRPLSAWLQLSCHVLLLLTGVYSGTILAFYTVPTAVSLVQGIVAFIIEVLQFRWIDDLPSILSHLLMGIWWWPISLLVLVLSGALFLVMPFALCGFYLRSGWRILREFAARYGTLWAGVGTLTVLATWLVTFWILQPQPQVKAFALLHQLPTDTVARQTLLHQSDQIRAGLLNAYLSDYRYLSSRQNNTHIIALYRHLGVPDSVAQGLQDAYNTLMSPFLYQGSNDDPQQAAELYASFFDVPIQKAEHEAIQRSLSATYNRDQVQAGLLNINQKKVWLALQEITVNPEQGWGEVEIHEVYQNQTYDQQEVLYYFSLPESAAITGVWLGDTEDRSKRFPFVVSPRGAAQQVYTDQVQQRVDPALLEQVGPQQYRLRAFPIPAKPVPYLDLEQPTAPQAMHLWLTYTVMQQEGGWPLPQLTEQRNIYWTNRTRRVWQGKAVAQAQELWFPAYLPADQLPQPSRHVVTLQNEHTIEVKPLSPSDYRVPQGAHLAVLLDSSRSMEQHRGEVRETFTWLQNLVVPNNTVDLYLTSSGNQPERLDRISAFDGDDLLFFGSIQIKEMLQQFASLRQNTVYDAILLVTDTGSYDLATDDATVPVPPAPLWMVHLGGLPPAYDDPTLAAIQDSGGGVAQGLQEAVQRFATEAGFGSNGISVVDGYAWLLDPAAVSTTSTATGLDPLAARQLVRGLSQTLGQESLANLDAIHAIAKQFGIVTPYSSMIVLVNDQQREALKQAEASADRFDREVETGTEQLTTPHNPFNVAAVPEPEEWLLIGLGLMGLCLLLLRQRYQLRSGSPM